MCLTYSAVYGMRLFSNLMRRFKELESELASLRELSHEDLLDRAVRLQRQNFDLENKLTKLTENESPGQKKLRSFDHQKYKKRRVAFQFAYLGWNYSGLAIQSSEVTVMQRLMDAFEKARLIEDRISCDFTVCGRTDKGVSALGQVVSLVVRSALVSGLGIIDDSGAAINERPSIPDVELDYVFLLNKLLPQDIRILAWSPVGADFSARFTCCQRSYTYFIPYSGLDITMMAEAAKRLEGTHDFRNFCSINLEHELPVFVRRIDSVLVRLEDTSALCDPTTMCEISITGSGFLYHQVRCIVALLVTIGRGYESPSLIDDLLDIEKTPAKPQYQMAADYPLILMTAEYPPGSLSWETSEAARFELVRHFQKLWSEHAIRARTSKVLLDHVEERFKIEPHPLSYLDRIIPEGRWRENPSLAKGTHRPILKRQVEMSVDEKLVRFKQKKTETNKHLRTNDSTTEEMSYVETD
ncbi:hypothetical protein T265_09821 [Opisthorchis viverrini]|uniref:tRNA pseudouridine synthase n=1 Tax=Opisthorchis viverrini TaxID=6198 RepID=A0A074Z4G8_OPIVI|nr:hypothetical protein T265_09821 [Opisthorchis viverrini]KER21991.1 hypothetical protein T265_09821 [Opisthorchis viverrini]